MSPYPCELPASLGETEGYQAADLLDVVTGELKTLREQVRDIGAVIDDRIRSLELQSAERRRRAFESAPSTLGGRHAL